MSQNNWSIIINNFNDNNRIRDVIETCTGEHIKGKSLCCPLHNDKHPSASIHEGKNIFTCWSSDCGRAVKPWWFVKKYYNLSTNKEVAEKVNQLFNANIPIYEKSNNKIITVEDNFDSKLKVNKYLSECINELDHEVKEFDHILLNANTGLGKTYGIAELNKRALTDYVFLLVPTRALAEDVANEYGYKLFYGDDTQLPDYKYIVATFSKINAINRELERINENRALVNEILVSYTVVVDEVHELMSKRNMYGNKLCMNIEEFIINSDASILMSANTGAIFDAYKDRGLFNRYINIESNNNLYNADKTTIYRLPPKKAVRESLLINSIRESLKTHKNVLLMEDSKKNLQDYAATLKKYNIQVVHINSENRNDEDIINEYNSIVNDSKLNNTVVMCTSLINAGVNINNENVCVMVIQSRNQFDLDKVEQFFGRIRSDKGNTCMLFLNQGEKNKIRTSKDYYINYYSNLAELKVNLLNEYYFNKYGLEPMAYEIQTDWNVYKNNDSYAEVQDLIYLENDIFKVDRVAIHEKARLRWLRSNYYDDSFICEMLSNLKTKSMNVIVLAPISEIKKNKEEETKDTGITFSGALGNVLVDITAIKEFEFYARGTLKPKDFKSEPNRVLYDTFKTDKNFRSLSSTLKATINKLLYIPNSTPISTMTNIMREYQIEQKKKERDNNITNIKRVEIYNKQFPLNEDVSVIGDTIYTVVRKNCDCFIGNNNPVSKLAYDCMFTDYMKLNSCSCKEGQWYDKKGKKIKPDSIKALLNDCICTIYDCSDKLHLYSLK